MRRGTSDVHSLPRCNFFQHFVFEFNGWAGNEALFNWLCGFNVIFDEDGSYQTTPKPRRLGLGRSNFTAHFIIDVINNPYCGKDNPWLGSLRTKLSTLIGWANTQNDPRHCIYFFFLKSTCIYRFRNEVGCYFSHSQGFVWILHDMINTRFLCAALEKSLKSDLFKDHGKPTEFNEKSLTFVELNKSWKKIEFWISQSWKIIEFYHRYSIDQV